MTGMVSNLLGNWFRLSDCITTSGLVISMWMASTWLSEPMRFWAKRQPPMAKVAIKTPPTAILMCLDWNLAMFCPCLVWLGVESAAHQYSQACLTVSC